MLPVIVIVGILMLASVITLVQEYSKTGVFRRQNVLLVGWAGFGITTIILIILVAVWQH